MPPTPLAAEFRLTFNYTVNSFPHKCRLFLGCTTGGSPSGYTTAPVNGGTAHEISLLADPFWTAIAGFYGSGASFNTMQLEEFVSNQWIVRYTKTTTVTPSNVSPCANGWGLDFTGKTDDNGTIHFYLYEHSVSIAGKIVSYASLGAVGQGLADYLFNTGSAAGTYAAWFWSFSRGAIPRNHWVADIIDTNEKLRRMRKMK